MENTESTAIKLNRLKWGSICLIDFFVSIMINIGLGNRTSASVPIYIAVIVIHIILAIVLIKGIISNNRRFVSCWLGFTAFHLILLNVIMFWLNLSRQMRLSFVFMAITNLFGIFCWLLTYSYFITMPLVIDVMFVAAQVHM